jgi:hypothetical protein
MMKKEKVNSERLQRSIRLKENKEKLYENRKVNTRVNLTRKGKKKFQWTT